VFNVISSDFSEHRVTSFRDLMHEDEDESGEEEGQRYSVVQLIKWTFLNIRIYIIVE